MPPRSDNLVSRPVNLSLLDRLARDNPKEGRQWPLTRLDSERKLELSVQENLEWLLNTRRIAKTLPDNLKLLRESVFYYGLPDLIASFSSWRDRQKLVEELEWTVRLFERRLKDARVISLNEREPKEPKLDFRIEGALIMTPLNKPVSYYTVMDLAERYWRVGDKS
jgi:type VI secretion system lysozyme-like protein